MKQELATQLLRSGEITRRDFAAKTASSLLGVGLLGQSLTNKSFAAFEGSSKLKQVATAKNVIYLFMAGGPSHVDLFDPKPRLQEMDGKPIPAELLKDHQQFALIRGTPALKGSSRLFAPCGRSGTIVSDWLPC